MLDPTRTPTKKRPRRRLFLPVPWLLLLIVLSLVPACDRSASDGAQAQEEDAGGGEATADSEGTDQDDGEDGEDADAEDGQRKRRERTTSVRVSEAVRSDLIVPVIAEGAIRARHSAELRTEIAGRLVKIAVAEGQTVSRGQLIAKIDDREYEVAAEEARAKYLEAVSLLAIEDEAFTVPDRPAEYQKRVDELKDMEDKGLITREERLVREVALDVEAIREGHYRVDVVSSRSGVAGARAQLERANLNLERCEIRAPFSGVVTGLELSVGEHLTVNETICTLVNNTDIEAEVGVLESDVGKLEVGKPALLALPALGDTVRSTVDVISPQFDPATRTCKVLLRLKNTSGHIRPGMFVRAIIAGESLPDRLLVPREAILTRDGRPLLFKVEGDRAKWLYLKLGRENDTLVEIAGVLQGETLEPGDRVVVADHLTLAHDAKIRVKKVLPIRDPWNIAD